MLTEKLIYTVVILGIQEAADHFNRQHGGSGTVWCHNLDIMVEATGESLPCQVCTDYAALTEFGPNDRIKIQAGKHTKGRTSVKFIEKMPPLQKPVSSKAPVYVVPTDVQDFVQRNPVVSGTAMDRALYNACHLYQMQGRVEISKVIEAAKEFHALLVEYTPQ